MDEREWLTSEYSAAMLDALAAKYVDVEREVHVEPTARKLRLAAVSFWWRKYFASGAAPQYHRCREWAEGWIDRGAPHAEAAALPASKGAYENEGPTREWLLTRYEPLKAAQAYLSDSHRSEQAGMLRCIFGNPWRADHVHIPFHKMHELRSWHEGLIPHLAEACYQERGRACERCGGRGKVTFSEEAIATGGNPYIVPCRDCRGTGRINDGTLNPERLAVLADALEEAGCADTKCDACGGTGTQDKRKGPLAGVYARWPCDRCNGEKFLPSPLLAHLRSPGPHARGCWAIDLLTGRS